MRDYTTPVRFFRAPAPSLPHLAPATGARLLAGGHPRFQGLVHTVDPRLLHVRGWSPQEVLGWPRGEGPLEAALARFLGFPFNGPAVQRLLGIRRGGEGGADLLLLGPERWDGALEAQFAGPELRFLASGDDYTFFAREAEAARDYLEAHPAILRTMREGGLHAYRVTPAGSWWTALMPETRDEALGLVDLLDPAPLLALRV